MLHGSETWPVNKENETRNAWQSPTVARQAQRTRDGKVTPLQRLNRRVCCMGDAICNEGIPYRVLSAQHVFVPGDLDL